MRRRRDIGIVGLLAATLGAAAVGVQASFAAPTRAATPAATIDATYSCRVRPQHFVDLYASATLPPAANNQPQPGGLFLTTGVKTIVRNNTTVTVAQVSLQARKNSLRIDKTACRRVKHQIPLKPKGLPGPPTSVTPTLRGFDNEQCDTTARVLVRLRLKTTNHTPVHAQLAIRNDDSRSRPIAFYNWGPRKVTAYTGKTCVTPG
jgi:hypothetical protein